MAEISRAENAAGFYGHPGLQCRSDNKTAGGRCTEGERTNCDSSKIHRRKIVDIILNIKYYHNKIFYNANGAK